MEALSFIALILLSLVGYAGGAVGRAGRGADLKPRILDLGIVLLIWMCAIYSRIHFNINKWMLIVVWIVVSALAGMVAISIARVPKTNESIEDDSEKVASGLFRNLWYCWKGFSQRMGSFQSRVILSLFFFVIVSPFALAVKVFSDPLRIKHSRGDSYWLEKRTFPSELEEFRRQF